jgi:hypothetical protein
MADKRTLAAVFAPSEADVAYRRIQLAHLSRVAHLWRERGTRPRAVDVLSTGEGIAVCLATGNVTTLRDPLCAFLSINGFLQRWVLEQTHRTDLIGTVLGIEAPQ